MAEDALGYLIYGLVGIVGLAIGAIWMAFNNPYWRIKQMRKYMKKNYVMLRFLTKNRRGFERIEIMNIDNDIICRKGKAIIADKGRIWRTDASNIMGTSDRELLKKLGETEPDVVLKTGTNKNDGFDFYSQSVREMLKMELDVPVLYIDEDNFQPIEPFLAGQAPSSPVSSSWLNTALNNAINIEVAKKLSNKNIDLKDIIMFAGLGICCYLVYQMGGTIDTMDKHIGSVGSQVTVLDTKITDMITGGINTTKSVTYNQAGR